MPTLRIFEFLSHSRLSKELWVLLFIGGGVLFLFLTQTPHDPCLTQIETFKSQQKKILPLLRKNFGTCRQTNQMGGCWEYFRLLRSFTENFQNIPFRCSPFLGNDNPENLLILNIFKSAEEVLATAAWGDHPPTSENKLGWLTTQELVLFCKIKKVMITYYGQAIWDNIQERTHSHLPGEFPLMENGRCINCSYRKMAPQALSPQQIWESSLFSINCNYFNGT